MLSIHDVIILLVISIHQKPTIFKSQSQAPSDSVFSAPYKYSRFHIFCVIFTSSVCDVDFKGDNSESGAEGTEHCPAETAAVYNITLPVTCHAEEQS